MNVYQYRELAAELEKLTPKQALIRLSELAEHDRKLWAVVSPIVSAAKVLRQCDVDDLVVEVIDTMKRLGGQ